MKVCDEILYVTQMWRHPKAYNNSVKHNLYKDAPRDAGFVQEFWRKGCRPMTFSDYKPVQSNSEAYIGPYVDYKT